MPHYRLLFLYGASYACLLIFLMKKGTVNLILALAVLTGPLINVVETAVNRVTHEPRLVLADFSPDSQFTGEVAKRLSTALTASDRVSAEAIGYIGYELPEVYIHDPMGLTDAHIARNGEPEAPFGKMDLGYTINTMRPSVMIWQFADHLRPADRALLDREYRTYCYQNCHAWNAEIVMIRTDRVQALSPLFRDWTPITLASLP